MPSVLVVCTGNICRSPLGEAALRARIGDRITVSSAGTDAIEGRPATAGSVTAGAERGLDLGDHRAHRLSVGDVLDADLVLCMERAHRDAIHRAVPEAIGRVFTFKEFVALLAVGGSVETITDAISVAARRRIGGDVPGELDVADPFGDDLEAYRRIAAEIDGLTARLAGLIAPLDARSAAGS